MEMVTRLNTYTYLKQVLLSLALVSGSMAADAQVLLNEDFSTANGATPPSNWLNEDAGGTNPQQIWAFNNPGGRTITGGTPGFSGQFAIIDSDYLGSGLTQNTNLVTPAFDATANVVYMLEFDDNWEECCAAAGQVQVFNGTAWVTVYTEPITGDGDGIDTPSVHRMIDITAATGNFNAAKVRFRYEGGFDYWWAIDNVKITGIDCTPPTATFSVMPDCANNQFSVNANITAMGDATSLTLSDGVTTYGAPITATGNYVAGPFSNDSSRTITLIHDSNAVCNVTSGPLFYNCTLPNDICANAVALTPAATCMPTAGTTAGATMSDPSVATSCDQSGNDVWFSFVATNANTSVQVSGLQAVNPDAVTGEVGLSVYNYNCADPGEPILCRYSSFSPNYVRDYPLPLTGLTIGQSYLIRVHNIYAYDGNSNEVASDYNFNICVKEEQPPVNDNCADAMNIPVGTGVATTAVLSTTLYSGVENGMAVPSCVFDGMAEDIWFTVTVPSSGNVTVQSAALSSDLGVQSVMEAYSGTCGNLTFIGCNTGGNPDSYPSGGHARLELTGQTAGAVLYIRILPYGTYPYGPLAMTAWDPVMPTVATAGTCTAAPVVTIDSLSGNLYRWVPILDAGGKLIAEIFPNGNALGALNTSLFLNTGAVRQANGVYYLDRNVTITPATQATNGNLVGVKLYALQSELDALTAMDPAVVSFANLNISKSQETCQSAVNAATVQLFPFSGSSFVDGSSADAGVVRFSMSSFSSFYLRGGNTPLPIVLKSITAKNMGLTNRIDWTTSSEASTDYFELERSKDAKTFQSLSRIAGKGKASDYVYKDTEPFTGDNFYRLKLISKDGSYVYSTIVKATVDAKGFALEAYPNPASKNVTIKVSGSANGDLVVTDLSGKVVLQTIMNGSASDIDFSKMAPGVYFIRYTDGNFSKTVKISRQ